VTVGFDLSGEPVAPRDAATVILVRDAADGIELFFVKRRADVRFMGGAFVFPGGKLEPEDASSAIVADLDDRACALRLGEEHNPHARALFVTAARECFEESGVLLTDEPVSAERITAARHALDVDKSSFADVLARCGATLALSRLVAFARWITPRGETRRFDARFFLALVSSDTVATHDMRETVASAWLSPQEALARAERREIVLVPPTFRTVQQLAQVRSAREALALARSPVPRFEPVVRERDGAFEILLPDDVDHPEYERFCDECEPSFVTRFVYDGGLWSAVRR
jgi:8-oxo-dGTP pyrophosphatase MutT (NUDIX family)